MTRRCATWTPAASTSRSRGRWPTGRRFAVQRRRRPIRGACLPRAGAELGGSRRGRGRGAARARASLRIPRGCRLRAPKARRSARATTSRSRRHLPRPLPVGSGPLHGRGAAGPRGFVSPDCSAAVIPYRRLVHRRAAHPESAGDGAAFPSFEVGDHVVHANHGIARFAGFEAKTVAGVTRDYVKLEYRGDDRVFAPTVQLVKIPLHRRAATAPQLSALGSSVRRSQVACAPCRPRLAGRPAQPLRRAPDSPGPPLSARHRVAARARGAFPYRETADQLDAIEAVKADMESARPMDRLICGDVGYGKTEVALRAAFKAAARGQAGGGAGADDGAGRAAPPDLPRAAGGVPVRGRGGLALRNAAEERDVAGPLRRRAGGHRDRHASPAFEGRAVQGPRPGGHRRGAALRRQAEGAAAPARS